MGSSLVSLVSPELGSLGLSLEKGASLRKFLAGDRVGAKFPFFAGFLQFPHSRRLRDNRQQLPGNMQKTHQDAKTKKNKEKNKPRKAEERENRITIMTKRA